MKSDARFVSVRAGPPPWRRVRKRVHTNVPVLATSNTGFAGCCRLAAACYRRGTELYARRHASRVFCCRSAVVFVDASSYPVDRMAVAAVPTLHCTGPPSSGAIKLLLRVSNNLIVAFSLWIGSSSSSSNML
jgi:hypothetical protein